MMACEPLRAAPNRPQPPPPPLPDPRSGAARVVLGPATIRSRRTSLQRASCRAALPASPAASASLAREPCQLVAGGSIKKKDRRHHRQKSKFSFWQRVMRSTKDDPDPAAPPLLGDIISGPTNFRHVVHATFDTSTAKFSGLPTQWHAKAGIFNRQFGVPLGSAPRIEVDGYSARIPAVLVLLRRELVNHDGLRQEGIFRVPASKMAQQTYKEQLDAGQFRGCSSYEDAPCMAALIKEWFRSLPVPLLNCLSRDRIVATAENQNGHAAAQDLIHELPEPNQSIFMWLLDLLADTACFEATNRMNVKALGIVLAPNLYTVPQTSSPMEVVALMDAAVRSVQACLRMRAETAHRPKMIGI